MSAIKIICVGRIKEKFYTEAVNEYKKRLGRYAKISISELADEKTPEGASPAEEAGILKKEGSRILSAVEERDYVLALAIRGRSFSSEALAAHLEALRLGGKSS
ncbi:MAG: 23S rRNA (pseudouridine(1915)-N(3))-methyltransferase RlmH, partial [Lachnospiraceae bacterium]|nr:23S rRNA (pseudouridine(1915)-N(3))-methyltransferase RlmH [Lachnospiraceae bacterium]